MAKHDLELKQTDVKTTFLPEELEEDIYMQQSKGFAVSRKEDYVQVEEVPLWPKAITETMV